MPTKKTQTTAPRRDKVFKLKVLKDSRRLLNISEAALKNGVSRNSVYRWKEQYLEYGEQGLENKKQGKTRRTKRTNGLAEAVLALAKSNPDWGCNKITQELNFDGKKISSPTVQSIFIEHDLATQADRCRSLEKEWMEGKIKPTDEQYKSMLKHNPCLNDRSFFKKTIDLKVIGVGVYPVKVQNGSLVCSIIVTIDLSSLSAKSFVVQEKITHKSIGHQQALIRQNAESFRDNRNQPLHIISSFKTKNFQTMVESVSNIRRIKVAGGTKSIGAIRYFFHLLADEFFPTVCDDDKVNNTHELNQRLQIWLENYNTKKNRPGFPTFGLTPYQCKCQIKPPANFCQDFPMFTPESH